METYTRSQRAEYNLHREKACERLGFTAANYNYCRRIGQALSSIDTLRCNGGDEFAGRFVEYTGERYFTDVQAQLVKLNGYLARVWAQRGESRFPAIYWYHQEDPRGCGLYLDTEPMAFKSYTDGVAIY